MIYKGSSLIFF
jgi:hypothetical protein